MRVVALMNRSELLIHSRPEQLLSAISSHWVEPPSPFSGVLLQLGWQKRIKIVFAEVSPSEPLSSLSWAMALPMLPSL
jgi:hypothetical protein